MPPKRKRAKVPSEDEEEEDVSQSEKESDSDGENSDSNGDEDDNNNNDDENGNNSGDEENSDEDDNDDNGSENEDSNDDDEEEDEEPASKRTRRSTTTKSTPSKVTKVVKTKSKTTKTTTKSKKGATAKSTKKTEKKTKTKKESSEVKIAKIKSLKKSDRIEEARKAYKWWEAPKLSKGINWQYLEHAGIAFPPIYVPHNIPLLYDGKEAVLTPEQEEVATFYAAMPEDGPQLGNLKTRKVFQQNFFADFKEVLGPSHVIKSFDKCDFSRMREHLTLQKNLKKVATDEEKLLKKEEKERMTLKYGYALIDGRVEKMGNFNMEPAGLFRGRGEHPKTGTLKKRCLPESVLLNLSEDAPVPICEIPGHSWKSVQHDPAVIWLCGWTENVQKQNKYVMLAASSSFKGQSDMDKYTKAIQLKSHIHKVRQDYTKKMNSKDTAEQHLGTAMWVIDVLALRVGGEKGEDEADTVGCCSLRVEHLNFNPDPNSYEIELEFLGKDSMLFKQTIQFAVHGNLGKQVYKNLQSFCSGKKSDQDVFDTLTPPVLNKHLNSLMKGLTAKVFRTYNASITLEKELPSAEDLEGLPIQDKVVRYNAANRQVAILCNHQKTVSKAAETMFENLQEKLTNLKSQLQELVDWKELVKKKKDKQIPLKADDQEMAEELTKKLLDAQARKESAKTNDEKLAAAQLLEESKTLSKQEQKRKFAEKHKFSRVPTVEQLDARIDAWKESVRKLEVDIRNRDENKEVALGTSKINYMDPRISVAWCKRCEVPIDKIFAKTLRDKFNWAMAVPPEWKFE